MRHGSWHTGTCLGVMRSNAGDAATADHDCCRRGTQFGSLLETPVWGTQCGQIR